MGIALKISAKHLFKFLALAIIFLAEQTVAQEPNIMEVPMVHNDERYKNNWCVMNGVANSNDQCPKGYIVREVVKGRRINPSFLHHNVIALVPELYFVSADDAEALPQSIGDGDPCTGTVMSEDLILTARHCAQKKKADDNYELVQELTKVVIGNTTQSPEMIVAVEGCYEFDTIEFIEPCRIDDFGDGLLRDLLIVRTKESITFPSQLISISSTAKPRYGTVVGYGATKSDGTGKNGVKFEGQVPIVSLNCTGSSNGTQDKLVYGCRPSIEMVAGRPKTDGSPGTDTCSGDSGGPIIVTKNATGNVWPYDFRVIGVTSRAIFKDVVTTVGKQRLCGDGGIYTVIDDTVLDWVNKVASQNKQQHFLPKGD